MTFLNELMNANGISIADISRCHNCKFFKNLKYNEIFKCNINNDNSLAVTVAELLYPEKVKYIKNYLFKDSKNWRKDLVNYGKQYKKIIITAMLFDTDFYVYASNWCYLMRLAADQYYARHKEKKFYVLDRPAEGYGAKIFDIGEPMVLEGTGVLTVAGRYIHEDNEGDPSKKIMKTTFNFEFGKEVLEGKDVRITIECDDNVNKTREIVIDSRSLQDGKNKVHKTVDLDFENGFDISVKKNIL